jgi:hypothetical protein
MMQPTDAQLEQINALVPNPPTSEELYGVSRQPEPTCPLINEAIEAVQKCQKSIRNLDLLDADELRDLIGGIERELDSLVAWGRTGILEDIRTRVTEVRQWGEEWKTLAKESDPP